MFSSLFGKYVYNKHHKMCHTKVISFGLKFNGKELLVVVILYRYLTLDEIYSCTNNNITGNHN